ncbi:hypothetical protein [Spirosoma arcticum]
MSYLRQNGKLIFTSGREVITHYTTLIEMLTQQLQRMSPHDCQAIGAEISDLRRQLADNLKNFGCNQVDEYFRESMANAESDQEFYELSNAYEAILVAELKCVKEKLHALRVS